MRSPSLFLLCWPWPAPRYRVVRRVSMMPMWPVASLADGTGGDGLSGDEPSGEDNGGRSAGRNAGDTSIVFTNGSRVVDGSASHPPWSINNNPDNAAEFSSATVIVDPGQPIGFRRRTAIGHL